MLLVGAEDRKRKRGMETAAAVRKRQTDRRTDGWRDIMEGEGEEEEEGEVTRVLLMCNGSLHPGRHSRKDAGMQGDG